MPGRAHLLIRAWGVGSFFMILSKNHSFSCSFILLLSLTSLLFRLSNLYPGTTTRLGTFINPRLRLICYWKMPFWTISDVRCLGLTWSCYVYGTQGYQFWTGIIKVAFPAPLDRIAADHKRNEPIFSVKKPWGLFKMVFHICVQHVL